MSRLQAHDRSRHDDGDTGHDARGLGHDPRHCRCCTRAACTWVRDRSVRRGRGPNRPCSCSDRRGRARRRRSWCPPCSARRARWCRRRPSPTCCGPPRTAARRVGPCFALRPERHRRRPPGVSSACTGHRWRAVARGTTRCSWPGASSARRDPAGTGRDGAGPVGGDHWTERAEALLAPAAARRRARRGGPRHGAVVGRPAKRRHRPRDPRSQRGGPPRRPPGGDRRDRPPRAERDLVDGLGGPRRLPQRGRPGHARWPRTSTPGPSATPRPRSISAPPGGTRPWPRPWWWGCSPTSAPPPTPVGRHGRGRRDAAGPPCAGGPRPGRGGQHRPRPRPSGHGERGRWPGTSHPGVPPGPLPGPGSVGRGRRRVPVAVRHDRGAARDRGRPHPRGAVRPRRARKRCAPGR